MPPYSLDALQVTRGTYRTRDGGHATVDLIEDDPLAAEEHYGRPYNDNPVDGSVAGQPARWTLDGRYDDCPHPKDLIRKEAAYACTGSQM